MSYSSMTLVPLLMIIISSIIGSTYGISPVNYLETFKVTSGRTLVLRQGKLFNLNLDKGGLSSSMESKFELVYGQVDMQIKLPDGDSRGTITTFYLTSQGYRENWEFGFKFPGTSPGQPHIVRSHILIPGYGVREKDHTLSFDPTTNFHTYSIVWNSREIILYADGNPIPLIRKDSDPSAYPKNWPMRIRTGIMADSKVAPNWDRAPFRIYYKDYDFDEICLWWGAGTDCI